MTTQTPTEQAAVLGTLTEAARALSDLDQGIFASAVIDQSEMVETSPTGEMGYLILTLESGTTIEVRVRNLSSGAR